MGLIPGEHMPMKKVYQRCESLWMKASAKCVDVMSCLFPTCTPMLTRKTPVPFTATFQQCPQPLAMPLAQTQEMAMTSSTPLFGSPTAQHSMGRRKAVRAKMMWSTPQWTFPFSLLLMPGKYVLTVGALFGKLVCTAWWECAAWGTYWADVLYSHHTVPVMGT